MFLGYNLAQQLPHSRHFIALAWLKGPLIFLLIGKIRLVMKSEDLKKKNPSGQLHRL